MELNVFYPKPCCFVFTNISSAYTVFLIKAHNHAFFKSLFSPESEPITMSFNSLENIRDDMSFRDLRHDEAAFEAFVKNHYRHLCVFCKFKFGFDIHLSEDVASTSFVKLWETRNTLADDASPKSYLYKIASNTGLNIL